jgi:hypothetical protein
MATDVEVDPIEAQWTMAMVETAISLGDLYELKFRVLPWWTRTFLEDVYDLGRWK